MKYRTSATVCFGVLAMMLATPAVQQASPPGARSVPLTVGWDIFDHPLEKGKVIWLVPDGQRRLNVTYILDGARPNTNYLVGAHFFDANADIDPIDFGAGMHLAPSLGTRDGVTDDVDAWEFGDLTTDSEGDGAAHFNLSPNPGTYYVQFDVREGQFGCWGCPLTFRTGAPYSVNTEEIVIP